MISETGSHRRLKMVLDIGERVFAVVLFASLLARFLGAPRFALGDISVLTTEGLVTVLMVTRRSTQDVSTRWVDWLIAFVGVCAPMLVRPGGTAIAPGSVCAALMLWGLVFSFWGQMALWRSFGLVAANRGVVQRGPYRFVRHPIYSGYVFTYVGFLLAHPFAWNIAAEVLAIIMMVIRILAEERVLKADAGYAEYMTQVRYRLLPGIF